MADFHPGSKGLVLKDGILTIFREFSVTRISLWPPRACRKTKSRPYWVHFRPTVDLNSFYLYPRYSSGVFFTVQVCRPRMIRTLR